MTLARFTDRMVDVMLISVMFCFTILMISGVVVVLLSLFGVIG